MVKHLLKIGDADLNSKDSTYGRSALSWAAGNGFDITVKLLINCKGSRVSWNGIVKLPFSRKGAEVDSVDKYGRTALSYAVLNGHMATARLLLRARARVD